MNILGFAVPGHGSTSAPVDDYLKELKKETTMTKDERLGLAREYFRQVMQFAEDIVDDEIYGEIDPENEFGDELAYKFNVDTIKEVFELGFKAKYGESYDE